MQKTLFTAALLGFFAPAAFACETWEAGDLTVQHAWSRATIGADRPAVFYVEITNAGTDADALIGITTPAAGMPMLHETVMTDGVASMPHAMSVPVPAGETVKLAPGSYHGMLMGLTAPLNEGDPYPMTLTFERAGEVTVDVEVVSMRAEGPTCEDGH
jgi:periplasmic copper chaperone A